VSSDTWFPRDGGDSQIIQGLVRSRGVTLQSISESAPAGPSSWSVSGDDAEKIRVACEIDTQMVDQRRAEESKFQEDRATGKDIEFNRVAKNNAVRAKAINKNVRERYARAVAACARAASQGYEGDTCPPKRPTCFNENGDLSEVAC
jgi:hypothetical protein